MNELTRQALLRLHKTRTRLKERTLKTSKIKPINDTGFILGKAKAPNHP